MTKRLKTVFIGCVRSSAVALDALIADPEADVRAVVTLRESKFNSDFVDIAPLADRAGIPVFYAEDLSIAALADVFRECSADIGFAVGWSRLIPGSVLKVPPLGIVGYHPAALPRNRGRHPIIWAIVLGLEWTASTFFLMDEGADSGPILNQERVEISNQETAGSLYEKLVHIMPNQIRDIVNAICRGSMQPLPQDHSQATYWRKRSRADGLIDWRMSSTQIDRLIRALAPPYSCAEIEVNGETYRVKCGRPLSITEQDAEPGKVIDVSRDGIIIKTGEGALLINDTDPELTLRKGSYL